MTDWLDSVLFFTFLHFYKSTDSELENVMSYTIAEEQWESNSVLKVIIKEFKEFNTFCFNMNPFLLQVNMFRPGPRSVVSYSLL